jgi:pyrroline-5-carboxylate reductase
MATEVLAQLREAEVKLRAFDESLNAGREISTVAPLRWGKRGALAQYLESYKHLARALRNTRVLVRRGLSMVTDDEHIPPNLIAAIRSLAESVDLLHQKLAEGEEPVRAREAALAAVRACAEAYQAGLGFSGSVVVAQIRSTASDLISATGLPPEEAHRLVRSVQTPGRE